jgi:hypothetical protein
VIKAQRARFLHRNGKLLLTFRQIQVPSAELQTIQGYLEGVEADWAAHLALDSEGTAQPTALKSRLIFPLIAATVAGLSFHQDYNAQGVPDLDSAGRAESGAVGLGLIGTVLAQIGPCREASATAILGAAFSMYTTFIARGEDVVLPADTPVTVSLHARPGDRSPRRRVLFQLLDVPQELREVIECIDVGCVPFCPRICAWYWALMQHAER